MNAINTTRRPRAVFGRRGRVAQPKISKNSGDSETSSDDQESKEDDVERMLNKSNSDKENVGVGVAQRSGKAKSKAAPINSRKPMRSRTNGQKSKSKEKEVICISSSDSDYEEEVDASIDAIRSPQKRRVRRGTSTYPILIESSDSDQEESDGSNSLKELTEKIGEKLTVQEDDSVAEEQEGDQLASLLSVCGQKRPQSFDECLDEIEEEMGGSRWKKVGEATYSEVYGLVDSDTVLKVIPLSNIPKGSEEEEEEKSEVSVETSRTEVPEKSNLIDLQREIEMTKGLSKVQKTFVAIHRASIVRGTYSKRLLKAWDTRIRQKSDLNVRPDGFESDQLFGLILLSDGGKDLESFNLQSWSQAASIYCQIVFALAEAEKICQFEHRDLHWGNVVIKETKQKESINKNKRNALSIERISSPSWSGVQATIIDFTLSRAHFGEESKTIAFDLLDDTFFTGKGDIQFDVYRKMRKLTKGFWQEYFPLSNVFWLHYLLRKISSNKNLKTISDENDVQIGAEATCFELLSTILHVLDDDEEQKQPTIKDAASLYDLLVTTLPGSDKSF